MKRNLIGLLLSFSFCVSAEVIYFSKGHENVSKIDHQSSSHLESITHEIQFSLKKINASPLMNDSSLSYLSEENIGFTKNLGEARLPYKSVVVGGKPEEIDVIIDERESVVTNIVSSPGQPEDCRCESEKKKWVPLKGNQLEFYQVEYLGAYRGQDLSRVTILAAQFDALKKETIFYPNLKATIRAKMNPVEMVHSDDKSQYDYLIVTPGSLLNGISDLVQFKSQKGMRVKVTKWEDIGTTVAELSAYFKQEYQLNHFKYALIVGTDDLIPNHKVNTSGSSQTPSDYPYFLMDQNDMIPDVHYGRVIASTESEVSRQVQKWIDYEDRKIKMNQFLHMIGIASNEGNNPSDDEYVRGMAQDLKSAFETQNTHFYQNDASSRPQFINQAFNKGAGLLVYLGHGSGTSWASTGQFYSTQSIKQIDNASMVKPVIIDVACKNGILKKGYFGETFMNTTNAKGESIGASMYYGGSVNISWHPPAIMARGMIKKSIANKIDKIGDALLAGHLYLLENHSEIEEVRDNFEWYHLFGEPSAPVYFQ